MNHNNFYFHCLLSAWFYLCTVACTLNPLLSPLGGLFFSSTFEGGLNREGRGGLINFPPLKRGGVNRGFTASTFVDNLVLCVLL